MAPLRYRDKMDEISDQPYSSVGQRDYFFSAELGRKGRSNTFPTTPDLVNSLNELNSSSSPPKLPSIADAHKSTGKHLQPYGGNWPDDSIRHSESYNKGPHRRFCMSVCFLKHAYTIMIGCLVLLVTFSLYLGFVLFMLSYTSGAKKRSRALRFKTQISFEAKMKQKEGGR